MLHDFNTLAKMSVIFFITVKITPILLLYMETYLVWSGPRGRYLQTSVSRSNFTASEDRFRLPCDEQAIRYLIGLRPQKEEIVTLLNFHNSVCFTQGFWKNMFFWWVNGHVRRSGGVNWVWVCCTQRRSWCWHPLCFFRFCLLGNINLHIWLPLLFFHTWEMRVLERQLTRANDPELELGVFMCFFSSPCFRNSFNAKLDKSSPPTYKLFLSQMPLLSDSRGILY